MALRCKYVRQRWRTNQKIRLVSEFLWIRGEAREGVFLRRNGLHRCDITRWLEQMKQGIESERPMGNEERRQYEAKIRKLEKELKEAKILIELQKKAKKILTPENQEDEDQKLLLKSGKKSSD